MDFMNLNQSAHGDREFGSPRDAARRPPEDRRRALAATRRSASASAIWARAACGWHEAQGLRVARFGDNMREVAVTEGDKVEAQIRLGVLRRTATASATSTARFASRRRPRSSTQLVAEYEESYDARARAAAGGRAARLAARRRAHRGRPARLPRRSTAAARSPTRSRISHGLPQLPGHRGAAADGRRLRLRRRRRLEDRRARADREGDGDRPRRAARRSWRTTPTTSRRARGWCSARTCSRSAPRSPRTGRRARSIRSRSAGADDPVRLVFTAAPGPAVIVALVDLGDRFRLLANEVDVVEPPEEPAEAAGRAGALAAAARLRDRGRGVARRRRPAPHRAHRSARHWRRSRTSPRSPGSSSSSIDARDTDPRPHATSCAGTRPTTVSGGAELHATCARASSRRTSRSSTPGSSCSRSATRARSTARRA